MPESSVDRHFHISLQHCDREDFALTREAIRVTRSGGLIMLNFRLRIPSDALLQQPCLFGCVEVAVIGRRMSLWRWARDWVGRRIGCDLTMFSNICTQPDVFGPPSELDFPFTIPITEDGLDGVDIQELKRVNSSHWWLVAKINK